MLFSLRHARRSSPLHHIDATRPHPGRPLLPGPFSILSLAVILSLLLAACGRDVTVIGILEVQVSDPMEETRTGFLETLLDGGYKAGENARFLRRNADIRDKPLQELAQASYRDDEVALLLALSTEALGAALSAPEDSSVVIDTPIVFAMSGDPAAVQAAVAPEKWARVTGAAALPPEASVIRLVGRLLPEITTLGILFVSSEPDSIFSKTQAVDAATEAGLGVTAMSVEMTVGVAASTRQLLAAGAEALYVTPSNLLAEEFTVVMQIADEAGVPVFTTREKLTRKGALASYEVDYGENGRRAGQLALKVLNGESPARLPVSVETVYRLSINAKTADRLGISLPADVVAEADAAAG